MNVDRLDHLVLTVVDIDAAIRFYVDVLGMTEQTFDGDRKALTFGRSKINLHLTGHEVESKLQSAIPGSADLCFVVQQPISDVLDELQAHGVYVEVGPVEQAGATGTILSVYFRDPDHNLIELSNYV